MGFSDRYGYTKPKEVVQRESIDDELKNRIWSAIYGYYLTDYENYDYTSRFQLIDDIYADFIKKPLDSLSIVKSLVVKEIRVSIFRKPWYEIYNFLQFILENNYINHIDRKLKKQSFIKQTNKILEEENSAYRIIDNQVTEITSEQEIQSIEDALENTNLYSGVQQHLKQALQLMSDRKNPDYRNSIKESISAVESICKIVTGNDKASLGQALKNIKYLPPTLQLSMDKLYGYTSREDGIRHAMLEESNLTYIDAKFMLVSCTNFINYLIDKTKDQT